MLCPNITVQRRKEQKTQLGNLKVIINDHGGEEVKNMSSGLVLSLEENNENYGGGGGGGQHVCSVPPEWGTLVTM